MISYGYRIFDTIKSEAMKITALLDDDLINEVKETTGGKNITESLNIALRAYLSRQKIAKVLDQIEAEPLQFNEDFTAYGIRKVNRNR